MKSFVTLQPIFKKGDIDMELPDDPMMLSAW